MSFDDEQNKYISISDLNFDEANLFDQFSEKAKEFASKKNDNIRCNREQFHRFCELYKGLVYELDHSNVNITATLGTKDGIGTITANGTEMVFNDSLQFLKLMKLAECCEINKKVDDSIDMTLTVWGLYEYI